MTIKKDKPNFQGEAKFSFSSIFNLGGVMSKEGADKAGNKVALGILLFLFLTGASVLVWSISKAATMFLALSG